MWTRREVRRSEGGWSSNSGTPPPTVPLVPGDVRSPSPGRCKMTLPTRRGRLRRAGLAIVRNAGLRIGNPSPPCRERTAQLPAGRLTEEPPLAVPEVQALRRWSSLSSIGASLTTPAISLAISSIVN